MQAAGTSSVEALLKAGTTSEGHKELTSKSGVDKEKILPRVNFADLYRIKGVVSEYSQLLELEGPDTVVELSRRVPANLHQKLVDTNVEKKLVCREPSLEEVQS